MTRRKLQYEAEQLTRPLLEEEEDEETTTAGIMTARISLDLLKKERTILISEVVTPKLTERLTSQLLWLDAESDDPIRLFINTPGGSADDGFAIHDMIRFVKSPVTNICVGLNASAGTIILLAVAKERRLSLPNSRLMIHQPSGGVRGTSSDVEITAEEIVKLRHRANELFARECDRPIEQVEKDMDRDNWLSPEEAQDYGLISKIIGSIREIK